MKTQRHRRQSPPDIEVADEIYFRHGDGPCCGKVVCHGKTGCMVDCEHGRHRVRYEHVLGHKVRVQPDYQVVHTGDDGMIVEHAGGQRRYIRDSEPLRKPDVRKSDPPITGWGAALFKAIEAAAASSNPHDISDLVPDRIRLLKQISPDKGTLADIHLPFQAGAIVHFKIGHLSGQGQIIGTGRDGATIRDDAGNEHGVPWDKISKIDDAMPRRIV